jgi:hypothetical protein
MDRKRGNGEGAGEIVRFVRWPVDRSAGKGDQKDSTESLRTCPFMVTRLVTKCNGASDRVSFLAFQSCSCFSRLRNRAASRVSFSSLQASRSVFQAACRVSESAVARKSVGGCALARHAAVFFSCLSCLLALLLAMRAFLNCDDESLLAGGDTAEVWNDVSNLFGP